MSDYFTLRSKGLKVEHLFLTLKMNLVFFFHCECSKRFRITDLLENEQRSETLPEICSALTH